jgi:hypothetical protein
VTLRELWLELRLMLGPSRRCVMLGCSNSANGRDPLCVHHTREQEAKIRRAVERAIAEWRANPRAGGDA